MGKTKVEIQQIQVISSVFQMRASSDPVSLQSDVSLLFALLGCNFTKSKHFPFNTQVRFMTVVNLKIRWSN